MHSVDFQVDSSGGYLLCRCLGQWIRLDYLGIESGIFDGFDYDGSGLL